jgi:hypothetical protein
LQRLDAKLLPSATIALAVFLILLTAILVYTVPSSIRSSIGDLLVAKSTSSANAVLSAWSPRIYRTFSFLLGFDFLYDVVHNNAVAVFVIWGATRLASTSALILASATAWVMWLDTALNVFENLAFLHIARSEDPSQLLPVASAIFSFRAATLALGFLIGLVLHALALRKHGASPV